VKLLHIFWGVTVWSGIDDGADFFTRGVIRVEVHYQGATAVTARRLREGQPITYYTSDAGAKSAAVNWLSAKRTHCHER
jgi:hypothetical protein